MINLRIRTPPLVPSLMAGALAPRHARAPSAVPRGLSWPTPGICLPWHPVPHTMRPAESNSQGP